MTTEHETVGDVLAEMHSMNASNPYAGARARRIERAHARESALQVGVPDRWAPPSIPTGADPGPVVSRDGSGWEIYAHNGCGYTTDDMAEYGKACAESLLAMLSAAPAPKAPPVAPDGLLDRIKEAEQRLRDGHAPRRIPADPSDLDLVLAETRMWLETGERPFWVKDAPAPAAEPAHTSSEPHAATDATEREMEKLIGERDRVESVLDKVLDHVLGADRREWSSAYGYDDAVDDVEDRMAELAPAPPAEPAAHSPATNGATEPCDALDGAAPCACGAWHPSPQAAQGDVSDLLLSFAAHLESDARRSERELPGDGDGPATLREWARRVRRLASAQPATAKPAGDAEFKVGDRVEYVLPPGGHRLLGTVVGFRVNIDETSAYIPCALPENLTRLTGGSHD